MGCVCETTSTATTWVCPTETLDVRYEQFIYVGHHFHQGKTNYLQPCKALSEIRSNAILPCSITFLRGNEYFWWVLFLDSRGLLQKSKSSRTAVMFEQLLSINISCIFKSILSNYYRKGHIFSKITGLRLVRFCHK